ncbi:FliA/WhiG family RNA polymerase sigma factor [Sanguibacter sp. 25GB23B1]|uniref:FliA/WhiG family RNA polymerase sigma factor n=1 Tax=unclassified Sanguibacter TaxID=2645534 RepID=UPI0032AF1108
MPARPAAVPAGASASSTLRRPARSGLLHARLDSAARIEAPTAEGTDGAHRLGGAAEVEILVVWEQYKLCRTAPLRERLILHYAPLVAMVASRVGMRLPSSVEHADLVSYGMFGLIDAIEKFEIGRDVKFETYANSRIRGAILDELRAVDWIPRSVRSKARAIDRAHAELEGELHRAPTNTEIAARMEITESELRGIQGQVANVNLVALDEVLGAGDRIEQVSALDAVQRARSHDPARTFEAKETKFLLSQAMEQLGEREKIMLVLYYYEGMTLAEIGRVLGVTESRISQMHTAAMTRLRTKLTTSEGL